MLHLILGTAGTGKTTLLQERIEHCVGNGGKAILLVPEQSSFESEKALYRRLGAQGALSVEVLSFTRLCDRIFRELGGISGVHMDDTAKYLLMSVALGELGGSLNTYRKNTASAAFAVSMCETISELKAAGVTSDQLREAAANADLGLAEKLADISLIFDAYQAIIDRGYSDPDDSLVRACKMLEEDAGFFDSYEVFIDGFMAFMGAEWNLIGYMLEFAQNVSVTLTCEGLADHTGAGVFSAAAKTANRFVEVAKKSGSGVAAPVILKEFRRFQTSAVAAVAADFPSLRHTRCDAPPDGVDIVRCEDLYDELEYVAARITGLVRENGHRYRDFAVIGRSLDRYLVPLQTVFERYDIPFFTDLRADIQLHPLVSGLLCALDAVRSNFNSEYMLSLAKKCTIGISPLDAGLLENYCFTWGVSGGAWTKEFTNNPDGMTEGFTAAQTARLERINRVREQLITPLIRLKKTLVGCDGKGFAVGVFQYLEQSGGAQHLQDRAAEMEEGESKRFLEIGAQVWDILIGLLDVFGGALAQVYLPSARLIDLFRMSIATADIGSLPQTLDQVIVGTADRIRPNEPRMVFVIGLNEGLFPLWSVPGGVFSPAEREQLSAQGMDLLRTPGQHALFEKYFVYFALTQASHRLCLTYPQRDTAGAGLAPSPVLREVREITGCEMRDAGMLGMLERVSGEKTAFDAAAEGWHGQTGEQAALRACLERRFPQRMEQLTQAGGLRTFQLHDRLAARELFGREMRISPSRVEQYYNCPFAYYCQVGLRLHKRKRAEFNPLESGSLIHLVLEKMVRKYGGKGLAQVEDRQLRQEISHMIEEDLRAKIQGFDEMPARFKYLFRRLVNTLLRLIKRLALEFAQSEFQPESFELPINLEAEVKPLDLQTPDGTRVIVEGVVDRVDVLHKNGVTYVRVVDYKSGRKQFQLGDVYHGLNMQMLIYLFSICRNPEETIPGGVLYMPARDSVISARRDAPEEEIREEQVKRLKMNGILLEDREMLCAMEPDLAGIYIPVKTKKDGTFAAASSLATLAQMGVIRRQVENNLLELAKALYGGNIAAMPTDAAGAGPCGWCDYHAVCGHEEGDSIRRIAALDKTAALEQMAKAQEE